MTDANSDKLEELIDNHGLHDVMEVISNICFLKAEHIRENWGEKPLAKEWEKMAGKINRNTWEI